STRSRRCTWKRPLRAQSVVETRRPSAGGTSRSCSAATAARSSSSETGTGLTSTSEDPSAPAVLSRQVVPGCASAWELTVALVHEEGLELRRHHQRASLKPCPS